MVSSSHQQYDQPFYTWTPDVGECATPFTLDVTISPSDTPIFSINDTYCSGETTDALPNISDNGYSGTWFPATISNTTSRSYTWVPDAGECATLFTLDVTISPNDTHF
ncbi:MAG: hypothetical protein R2795_22760 [Saprospiraceae bacterium]